MRSKRIYMLKNTDAISKHFKSKLGATQITIAK